MNRGNKKKRAVGRLGRESSRLPLSGGPKMPLAQDFINKVEIFCGEN